MPQKVSIIAGHLRGQRLAITDDPALRPTSSRLRETVMMILHPDLPEVSFVDLFAGSGAIGLEAASRGARSVTFVENSPASLTVLQKNTKEAQRRFSQQDLSCPLTVIRKSVQAYLKNLSEDQSSGIFWADPPYAQATEVLKLLDQTLGPKLHQDSQLVTYEFND